MPRYRNASGSQFVMLFLFVVVTIGGLAVAEGKTAKKDTPLKGAGNICVDCHRKITPGIVNDWAISKHADEDIDCSVCHGEEHKTADDVEKVELPTPETCADCHEDETAQFMKGKHALAWTAMKAMPSTHMQPMALIDGMKGCGGCHKIGVKSKEDIEALKKNGELGFGLASCDACHTRHSFSVKEAREPEACQTCHMGFDHPQWEMYSSSKHGVRHSLKQKGILPASASAPTCQTCHMPKGNHEVGTSWGFLAVRLPLPKDKQWAADQTTILKALGVLDPSGKPTPRLEVVKKANVARLTEEAWQSKRTEMLKICSECHSDNFAKAELEKGDKMIKEADHLMAEAITLVAGLYKDGLVKKPKHFAYDYPDLLSFQDVPTVIEQKLHKMFLKHRMRTFQGAFHANPDYTFWYGWAEMLHDIGEIRKLEKEMREDASRKK